MKKIIILAAIAGAVLCPATAAASDTERGEAAVAYVGPYDNPKVGSESMGAVIPFDTRMEHNFCQTLYTPDVLTDLNQVIDGKLSKSEISALTFKMADNCGAMPVGQKKFTVYVQNVDATTFPTVNNVKQWFTVETTYQGFGETEEYEYYATEDLEFTITLETPIVYEGKSLLITWLTDGLIEDGMGGYFDSQTFQAPDGQTHSGIRAEDYTIGIQTGELKNSSKDLPVLKLDYVPVFEENGLTPVSITNVDVKLEAVNLSAAVASYYSKANAITVTFDVDDATNGGEYDIYMGTQKLGTITGNSGTVRFLPASKNDIVIRIEPTSDDAVGTSYTIAKADIDALFPAPGVSFTGSYALYTEYDIYNDMEGTIQGAALYRMTSTAPVARMWAYPQNPPNTEAMYRGGTEYPDNLMALVPRTANSSTYSDMERNGGLFAIYAPNLGVGKLRNDVMQWPESVKITILASCAYPLLWQSVPTVLSGKVAIDREDEAYGTVDIIERDFEAGDGYPKNAVTANMPVDATHFKQDVIGVDRLRVQRDLHGGTLQFFAPFGLQIQYRFEAASRAEGEWIDAPTNPWTFYTKESGAGTLTVRTVNPKTGEQKEMKIFDIDENGGFLSSLQTVNAGQAASQSEIFDLQGRRLAAPVKGINIINGKKVLR